MKNREWAIAFLDKNIKATEDSIKEYPDMAEHFNKLLSGLKTVKECLESAEYADKQHETE